MATKSVKWTKKQEQILEEMYASFVSYKDISKKLGKSTKSIERKVYNMGLSRDDLSEAAIRTEVELARIRAEEQRLKKVKKKLIKEKMLEDRIVDALKSQLPVLSDVKMIKFKHPIQKRTKEQAVLAIGDVHAGEKVNKEEMGGINEFDMNILEERIIKLVEKSIDLAFVKLQGYKFDKLHVLMLGDMVSGIIHDELAKTMDGPITDIIFKTAYILSNAIRELKKYYPQIEVTCVYGNHGRLAPKITFKRRYENWDYIMYKFIEIALKDVANVTFNIPKSFWTVVDLNGHRMLVLHGNNIRGWNGVPYYGIQKALGNFEQVLNHKNQSFDSAILGHFHQRASLPRINGEVLVNGSVVGADEFALGALWSASGPSQLFFGVNPDNGITWRFPIKL